MSEKEIMREKGMRARHGYGVMEIVAPQHAGMRSVVSMPQTPYMWWEGAGYQ